MPSFPDRFGILRVGFCGGRKTEEPREKPSEQDENQQHTQPTCDVRSRNQTRATLVEGKSSHHFTIPPSPSLWDTWPSSPCMFSVLKTYQNPTPQSKSCCKAREINLEGLWLLCMVYMCSEQCRWLYKHHDVHRTGRYCDHLVLFLQIN